MTLQGLKEIVLNLPIAHETSSNLKLAQRVVDHAELNRWRGQLKRSGGGTAYGRQKWGLYDQGRIHELQPPSGWRHPFNSPSIPYDKWVVDENRIDCIRRGTHGPYNPGTQECWYNTSLLSAQLPPGVTLPPCAMELDIGSCDRNRFR